jgi:hypothetical protein
MQGRDDIGIESNFYACLREGGKIVTGSRREGHNIFTSIGRNWLSKLVSWQDIGSFDTPYTRRRVRWIGVGSGSQLEVESVNSIANPSLITSSYYLVAIQSVEFPTSTSVRFIKEFALNEISFIGTPVTLTEAGLFVDVNPADTGALSDGSEDLAHEPGVVDTTLNPALSINAPVAYKSFEPLTKTVDFTLEVRWDFRFE